MSPVVRSEQRLIVTLAALLFGPFFVLGPAILGVWIFVALATNLLGAGLMLCLVGLSTFFAYHMSQNYHWVECDGLVVRGQKFWSRRRVTHSVESVTEIKELGGLVLDLNGLITDMLLGSVRGYEIRFREGPSVYLVRHDMKNVDALVIAVAKAILDPRS